MNMNKKSNRKEIIFLFDIKITILYMIQFLYFDFFDINNYFNILKMNQLKIQI